MKKNKPNNKELVFSEEKYKTLRRDFIIINSASLAAGLIMLFLILLQRFDILPNFPCVFHELLHLYCPGCGGTRAFFEMLHGHFLKSLYYNPGIILGVLLILYYEVGVIVTLVKKNGRCYYVRDNRLVYLYLILDVIFTVFRNYLLIVHQYDMLGDFIK